MILGISVALASVDTAATAAAKVAVGLVGILLSVVVFGLLALRCARMGVYGDRPRGLLIRGLVRTRIIPWHSVIGAEVYTGHSGRGGTYYGTRIVFQDAEHHQRPLHVWWLASTKETAAQQWVDRVNAVIAQSRSTYASP
ncbi:hypothetical protein F4553_001960 [Allocatelliglobosispora scoriae]|uniref:PH domain-containing protein n=1 Tax=Allocatelliglobosispora scoriae TaxID=643052 RepID=A0A841BP26_9ACTN|nr:hypothetical protein [Allocatelliglobosispora scoriae]MBB5868581.1 hypothetical protein [Allocatelliglobosispora scoriae]